MSNYIDRFDVSGTEYLLRDSEADHGGDYQAKITASGLLKGDGSGNVSAAVKGTDYAVVTKATVTLSATWSGEGPYTQAVTLAGVTANSKVDLEPEAAVIQQLIDDRVSALYISNTDGVPTAYAVGAAPTTELTMQVTMTEVSA